LRRRFASPCDEEDPMMLRTLAATILLCACAHAQTAPPQAPPDCSAPEHRAFDFWIGEWDAYVTGTENKAGRSSIRSEDAGCVITEHWTSVGQPYSGRSLNIYDRQTGEWNQFWADSTGEVTRFVGGPHEGGMRLTDPTNMTSRGGPVQTRMTFSRNGDGSVRQLGETSVDGETWTARYDFTYRRRAE
jgi:hypothetical protein